MMDSRDVAVERVDGLNADTGTRPAMLTVHEVSQMLNCSARTIHRMTDSGRMPRPIKLGALARWPRGVLEQWIASGCPRVGKEVR